MARNVSFADIIQNRGTNKEFREVLTRCQEMDWTVTQLSGGGYRVTSPDGGSTFRVPNSTKGGDVNGAKRTLNRWLAQAHADAAGLDVDLGEVDILSTVNSGPDSSVHISCGTHDKTFTSVDGWLAHLGAEHAKMQSTAAEPEITPSEPDGDPVGVAVDESQEVDLSDDEGGNSLGEDPILRVGKPTQPRKSYRKKTVMRGWLAPAIWKAVRSRSRRDGEGLSVYCQAIADLIDPERHPAPPWAGGEVKNASQIIEQIKALLGVDDSLKTEVSSLEEEMAALQRELESKEKVVARLRATLTTLSELAKEEEKES